MPQKLGQHFLKNKSVLSRIADEIDIREGEAIIEIGPGHGELTEEIAKRAKGLRVRIIVVEKDKKLAAELKDKKIGNAEIVEGDALKEIPKIVERVAADGLNYKVAGNIPYYITGHLLRIIGELDYKPKKTVLLIQKEVAQRICAVPPHSSLLSLSVRFWAEPKLILHVSKKYFSPPPEVESAVIALENLSGEDYSRTDAGKYYSFIKKAFAHPRKTLLNNLVSGGYSKERAAHIISALGLDPSSRPQELFRGAILSVLSLF